MSKSILYDATMCIDCKACEQACAAHAGLPYDDKIAAEEYQSAHKLTAVLNKSDKYMRRLCMHCQEPACASVCPVAALQKTELGPVIYDEHRCIGCRYCMAACPFTVPKYEWEKALPAVRKCTMCYDRVSRGEPTACAEACPTGATKFGERGALLKEAQERIDKNPSQYVNHIFGQTEVGGTSVFLLTGAGTKFENYGLRADLVHDALPMYTFRVLSRIPDFVPIGGMLLGGIWWITHRREDVAAAEEAERGEKEKNKGGRP
jgi:formate dehydrogenase iron-sulfur subunit